jgi:hypothetical protein
LACCHNLFQNKLDRSLCSKKKLPCFDFLVRFWRVLESLSGVGLGGPTEGPEFEARTCSRSCSGLLNLNKINLPSKTTSIQSIKSIRYDTLGKEFGIAKLVGAHVCNQMSREQIPLRTYVSFEPRISNLYWWLKKYPNYIYMFLMSLIL